MSRASTLSLRLEPWAGADIIDCAIQAIAIAGFLPVDVVFNFNGIEVHVFGDDTAADVAEGYRAALKNGKTFCFATARHA